MLVTGSSNVAPVQVPSRYFTGPKRGAALRTLVDHAETHGTVPDVLIRRVALTIHRSPRQVRRMLAKELDARAAAATNGSASREAVLPVPRDFLVFAASLGGNIAQAHREYDWGPVTPHYSTVLRRMDSIDTSLVAVLRKGIAEIDRYLAVGIFECQFRNERWTGDETHIPVPCRGPNGRRIDNLQLLSFFDDFSRYSVNNNCGVGPANGAIVRATFARAVAGDLVDGVHIAGAPDVVVLDNAEAFKGVQISRAIAQTDVTELQFARPHTPQDKGKLERWHRTLKYTWLAGIAGFLKGPVRTIYEDRINDDGERSKVRIERAYSELKTADLPHYEALIAAIYEIVAHYNREHVVSTTGLTPLAKYATDTSLQVEIDAEAMWDMALPRQRQYQVEGRGINLGGTWYDAPALELRRRESVSARILPGMNPIVLAGHGDQVIAALSRKVDEVEGERIVRAARNSTRQSMVRRLLAEGGGQSISETQSREDPDEIDDRGRSRGKRASTSRADDDILLEFAK